MRDGIDLLRGLSAVSLVAALVIVAGVGALSVYASFANTWHWFFRMEQAASLAVPVVVGLLGLSVTSAVGVIVGTR